MHIIFFQALLKKLSIGGKHLIQIKNENIANFQVSVILPTGYDTRKRYRTIYLQDGGNAAKQALNYIDHLIITKQIEPIIIIGIHPNNQEEDYTPWQAAALQADKPASGGKAAEYLYLLVNEIKPFIDKHYASNPSAEYTAIGGCSFGGLVSIFASYYYPETFHHYIILSASFWYEGVLNFIEGQKITQQNKTYTKPDINRQNHKMYLYVGELEGIHRDSVQKHMVEYTKQVVHEIKQEGFSEANLLFETAAEGTHDVYFFSPHFIRSLFWLYGN